MFSTSQDTTKYAEETVETMASPARTFIADGIEALVKELGKSRLKRILDEETDS